MQSTENQKLREALRFTKKPVTIEAVQFTKALRDAILFDGEACPDGVKRGATILHLPTRKVWRAEFFIQTLEGKMTVSVGDWIIKGVKDEYYPCKPDIFEATYAPAAEQALALPTAAPVGDLADLPRYTAWSHLKTHGSWPEGIDRSWMKDEMGRYNDVTVSNAVIAELRAALPTDDVKSVLQSALNVLGCLEYGITGVDSWPCEDSVEDVVHRIRKVLEES